MQATAYQPQPAVDPSKVPQNTLESLLKLTRFNNARLADHESRVTRLAGAIAGKMDLTHEQRESVVMCAMNYDIGMLSIPDEILQKTSRLTKEEFEQIKQHTVIGSELLKPLGMPWPVAEAALQHHERLDGSGYPNKLKGNNIILEARIIAVTDVIDAMHSDRPYQKAVGIYGAIGEIASHKGEYYDETAVDICAELFQKQEFDFAA